MNKKNLIILSLLSLTIFTPILFRMQSAYDYVVHAEIAARMMETGFLLTPHFLYQALLIPVARLLSGNYPLAGTLVTMLTIVATTLIIQRFLDDQNPSPALLPMIPMLLLASPVLLPALLDDHLYFGYLGINVYHNPTILLLKPLALVSFFFAAEYVRGTSFTPQQTILACLATVLAASAKPSFTICIIPAIMVMTFLLLRRGTKPDWKMLIGGFMLPAIAVLFSQYLLTYSSAQLSGVYEGKSSIVLAPFLVVRAFSSLLPLKFLCSVLFPLIATICYPAAAKRDSDLLLAWVAFFFGAVYSYFLAESGPRLPQGNFLWSGQITLFILFVVSTRFIFRQAAAKGGLARILRNDIKLFGCAIILSLHLLSGLVFYAAEFYETQRFW